MLNRRNLLKSTAAIGGVSAYSATLAPRALAADTTGYKALVALFMFGGIDTHDVVLPYDQASYDAYTDLRAGLMDLYSGSTVTSRARDQLLPLSPLNAANFGGRQFALGQESMGLHQLFAAGRASIVGNVGPLADRFTRSTFVDDQTILPPKLFSHNDQQSVWMSLEAEGAQQGWAGRFADAVIASNANQMPVFTSISLSGQNVLLTGANSAPFSMSYGAPPTIRELERYTWLLGSGDTAEAKRLLEQHLTGVGTQTRSNLLERDVLEAGRRSIETNRLFSEALGTDNEDGQGTPFAFPHEFPTTRLGVYLQTIAETILARQELGVGRQLFIATRGGFDTHDNQAVYLPDRFGDVAAAITAFDLNMQELGLGNDVTLFTMSDFGRTLTVNGDGTDHGWGSHHFIVGGAASGQMIHGDIPPPGLEHEWDAGNGALIPTTSVEQYAAALGNWFGLTGPELLNIFPRLTEHGGAVNLVS